MVYTSMEEDITLSRNIHFYFPLLRHFYIIIYNLYDNFTKDCYDENLQKTITSSDYKNMDLKDVIERGCL